MRQSRLLILVTLLTICIYFSGLSPLCADIPRGYYDRAEGLEGEELKSALHEIIKGHKKYNYGDVWNILRDTDEDPDNPGNVIFLYSGWSKSKLANGGNASQWNREHVWAKSHGNFGTMKGPGTDAHHLRPTDVTINSTRSNLDFDNGGEIYTDPDGPTQCRVDGDSWEPADMVKGDVARMIFYMAVRYEGGTNEPDLELNDRVSNGKNPRHGKLSVLLQWHRQDPVDDWERRRNDRVYKWQNNRNPFIDHPEFAEYIWGEVPVPGIDLIIDNLEYTAGTTDATIAWTTNEPANSVVYYGTSWDSLIDAAHSSQLDKEHKIILENLEPGTTYHFSAVSTTGDGGDIAYTQLNSFTTLEDSPIPPPPAGRGIVVSEIAANPGGSYRNEYIELYNASDKTIDISNWDVVIHRQGSSDIVVRLGVTGTARGELKLPPGGFYVITRGTVGNANKTMYDGFYLNRLFDVELKDGNKVKDTVGGVGDRLSPGMNYELRDVAVDNGPVSAWTAKSGTYRGTPGSLYKPE